MTTSFSLLLVFASTLFAQDPGVDWDTAFADRSGAAPLHFVAAYTDARGTHRLEEWRTGATHLRRRTDNRIDLHADATSKPLRDQPADYVWQVIDLDKHIDNRISSAGMLHAGMFYSFYSMAHVLTRPAGRFRLTALAGEPVIRRPEGTCSWYEVRPDAQPATRICWSARLGVPFQVRSPGHDGAWVTAFQLGETDRRPIAAAVFTVNPAGLQIRNHDELIDDD